MLNYKIKCLTALFKGSLQKMCVYVQNICTYFNIQIICSLILVSTLDPKIQYGSGSNQHTCAFHWWIHLCCCRLVICAGGLVFLLYLACRRNKNWNGKDGIGTSPNVLTCVGYSQVPMVVGESDIQTFLVWFFHHIQKKLQLCQSEAAHHWQKSSSSHDVKFLLQKWWNRDPKVCESSRHLS